MSHWPWHSHPHPPPHSQQPPTQLDCAKSRGGVKREKEHSVCVCGGEWVGGGVNVHL